MTEKTPATDNPLWNQALGRGGELTQLSVTVSTGASWDYVATRGVIATALYALAVRGQCAVSTVGLDALAYPLWERTDYLDLVTAQMAAAGHRFDQPDPTDPVSQAWAWLNRYWPTRDDLPEGMPAWDGLARGIALGLRRTAIDICLFWAAAAVGRALEAERGAVPRRTPVVVNTGEFAGARGFVESTVWPVNAATMIVEPGLPLAYMINLGKAHGSQAEQLLRQEFDLMADEEKATQ
ncbi:MULTISPECIES: dirigent protein [unclassified Crossiella]|uniref:dirigent protein n=1 Tax=unclassified Crossiella TaxID=2620835 RepID=UPI001FFE9274|nr:MULTISPECIES: dirigent protein [unclassified Crossiella]MCK2240090.1 dirigent protein [Crossiella sp. S99.2]MCK2252799.1 dirigent protein [Crossiella sp. S99.1]